MQQYANADVTVQIPNDWQSTGVLTPPTPPDDGAPVVTIERVRLASCRTLPEHADAVLVELARLPAFDLLWRKEITVDGHPAVDIRSTAVEAGRMIVRELLILVGPSGDAIHIAGRAHAGHGAAMEAAVAQVAAGTRVIPSRLFAALSR